MSGLLNRLFGRDDEEVEESSRRRDQRPRSGSTGNQPLSDEQAIERYRYMLRTAPPEAIEQAHAEAFAQLTPDQRQQVLAELSRDLPEHERPASGEADPQTLARTATRAELRQPGTLERTFVGMGPGMGFGTMIAGSFFSTIAGVVVGTAIADAFFNNESSGGDADTADSSDAGADDAGTDDTTDSGDTLDTDSGDFADGGFDSGNFGGDLGGDFGGDFGGGDF